MKRTKALSLVAALICIATGCSSRQGVLFPENLPPPKPELYKSIRDMKNWENPYLVVGMNGIILRGDSNTIQLFQLEKRLAMLPAEAWPYGRVIAVQSQSILSGVDDPKQLEYIYWQTIENLRAVGLTVKMIGSA